MTQNKERLFIIDGMAQIYRAHYAMINNPLTTKDGRHTSVIYGFWGLMVLVPIIIKLQTSLGVSPYGVGILAASLILALMIIPYSVTLGKDVIDLVPNDLIEAAIGLGATPFEIIIGFFLLAQYLINGMSTISSEAIL